MRRDGLIGVIGVVLLLAACTGTAAQGPLPPSGHASAPPAAALTMVTAPSVVTDYSRRNNAVLATLTTTYSEHAWDAVDDGPLLDADRFDSAVSQAVSGHSTPLTLTFTATATWANGFTSYPIWAIVRTSVVAEPPQGSGGPDDYLLVVRRDSATARWRDEMIVPVEVVPNASDDRPGTTTPADVARAQETRLAIARYLETGDTPDVYVTPYLSAVRTQFSEPQSGERARSATCRAYPAAAPGDALPQTLRVVRSPSGVLALMTLRCVETRVAVADGTVRRPAGYAAALGVADAPAATLTQDFEVTLAVSRPTRGRAIVVGTTVSPVRPVRPPA